MPDGQIVFNQRWQGQEMRNVTTWSNLPTDLTEAQSLADAIRQTFSVNAPPAEWHNGWTLYSLTFVYNDSAPIFSIELPFTLGAFTGGNAGDPLPAQIAQLVSLKYIGPPPNRGRIYFAGGVENSLSGGQFTVGNVSIRVDLVQAWADGVAFSGGSAFLRIGRKNEFGILTLSSPVNSVIGEPIPATQRRRRVGVGT